MLRSVPTPHRVSLELACLAAAERKLLCEVSLDSEQAQALRAQIDVLERWLDPDAIDARYPDAGKIQTAAADAAQWLAGHIKRSPSKNWKVF